jgi:membrane fusion protein, multidrug efflux system
MMRHHSFRARIHLWRSRIFSWLAKHPVASVCGALIFLFVVFELVTQVFIFCRDAYVTTDIVFVAPEVAGPIATLPVTDNQPVEMGAILFTIDPEPFEIALRQVETALELSKASLGKAKDQLGMAISEIQLAQASLDDAQKTRDRIQELSNKGAVSQQALNDAEKDYQVALAKLHEADNTRLVSLQEIVVQTAAVRQAEAAVAKADYELRKTIVYAPVTGRVAPLRIRPGQYIQTGVPAVAVVSSKDWRVVANLPQRHLAGLLVGQKVWFTIGSDPWHFHVGKIKSIAPGVARSQQFTEVLPYVAPTTDWIRLPRRFPVEIDVGKLPQQQQLYQGADATVWMIR